MKRAAFLTTYAVVMGVLAGCGNDHPAPGPTLTQAQPAGAPQNVVVQQPSPQSGGGLTDTLTGAAMGFMAANIFNNSGARQAAAPQVTTQIIERKTILYRDRPAAVLPAAPVAPVQAAAAAKTPAPAPVTKYQMKPAPAPVSKYQPSSSSKPTSSYSRR